jgi:hypothetical protein
VARRVGALVRTGEGIRLGRHIAGTAWSTQRYLNIELLKDQQMRGAITATVWRRQPKSKCERFLTRPFVDTLGSTAIWRDYFAVKSLAA